MGAPTFKHADVQRLIRAATAAGLVVEAVEIAVDGALRVLTARPTRGVAVNDDGDWVSDAGAPQDHGRA